MNIRTIHSTGDLDSALASARDLARDEGCRVLVRDGDLAVFRVQPSGDYQRLTSDFADRLSFSATRARRLAIRRAVQTLSARAWAARLCARRSCTAVPAGDTSSDAQPRALRYPWTGGYVSLARAAGVERIAETFRAPRSCSADDGLDFDLFASPVQQVTTPKASSIDRRKAGPHGRLPRRFEAPRGRHSQKPEESYRRIERVSPGPRAEIFAREKREGWDVWGNEVAD